MMLRNLAVRRKFGMLSLLRKIFGVKTEKQKAKESSKKKGGGGGSGNGNPKGKGHGRNGQDQFTDAKRVSCKHEELADGDQCPECGEGVLRDDKPAIHQHWTGHSPLQLTLYELQRLVCNRCRVTPIFVGVDKIYSCH